jgi:KaiC/GvpD/RAD55 family RecA-like ATPase
MPTDPMVPAIDAAQADRFLSLLGKSPSATRLRAFPHRRNPQAASIGPRKGPYDLASASRWQQDGRGIYLVVNDGGDTDSDITACRAFFLEWDDRPVPWQLQAWQTFGLGQPTISVITGGKSAHLYWVLADPISPAQWEPIQAALIHATGADPTNRNPSRVMRLPGGSYIDADGHPIGQTRIHSATGTRYTIEQVQSWLPQPPTLDGIDISGQQHHQPLPPRAPDTLRHALQQLPPFRHGAGQYQQLLGLALRLHVELGAEQAQSLLAETCCQSITDLANYFRGTPTQISPGSIWPYLRDIWRIDISRQDLRSATHHTPPAQAPTGASQRQEQQADDPTYLELLEATLQAIEQRDVNAEMLCRAQLSHKFRRNDDQINAALFDRLRMRRVQPVVTTTESVDLTRLDGLEYLLDGWIIRNQLHLTYGAAGTGKTTLCLAKALAVCRGTGLLDRSNPAPPGRVLYIATDSGAEALRKALDDMDAADDPMLTPGPDQRLFIWADAPEQGQVAWCADINGMVRLVSFIERHHITYVIIDSAKAVTSRAGISYLSNESTATLLTYMAEVICRALACAIDVISHDGTATGSNSGAKAWAEIPSMVVSLQQMLDDDGRRRGTVARVVKDRAAVIDPGRRVMFDLDREQAELILLPGQEVVGNAEDAILTVLADAHANDIESIRRSALIEEVARRFSRSASTVDNTIPNLLRRRLIVRPRRGWFALSPAVAQMSLEARRKPSLDNPPNCLPPPSGINCSTPTATTDFSQLPDDCPTIARWAIPPSHPQPPNCPSGNSQEGIGQSQIQDPDSLLHLSLPDHGDNHPLTGPDPHHDAPPSAPAADETGDWYDEFA